jgi:hypothetical protein
MNNFQRIGSISNAHEGKDFEIIAKDFFANQGLELVKNYSLDIGTGAIKKPHSFDLGSERSKSIIECKSHRWTTGDNTPSAKLTVWNEAMYYFLLAPESYRKILFILKDYSQKRKKTLAEYYVRIYGHLIPLGVELWEYDSDVLGAKKIN